MSGVIVSRCICQTRDRAQDSISTALGIQPAMEASRRVKYLEEIYAIILNDDLVTNSDWHEEAEKKFPQAFGELMQKIEDLENQEDDSCIDELVSLLTERPKNLPDPVFSRFMTVLMCTKGVTANWPIISLWQLQ